MYVCRYVWMYVCMYECMYSTVLCSSMYNTHGTVLQEQGATKAKIILIQSIAASNYQKTE